MSPRVDLTERSFRVVCCGGILFTVAGTDATIERLKARHAKRGDVFDCPNCSRSLRFTGSVPLALEEVS